MTTLTDIDVACRCGTVRGRLKQLRPERVNVGVCYCRDCQAFAQFLGEPEATLDPHGGTLVVQTSPASLSIDSGKDEVACIRHTPKGLLRWYAACCKTPIANSMQSANGPFIGVIHSCIGKSADGRGLTEVLGEPSMRIFGKHAVNGPPPAGTHDKVPLAKLPALAAMFLGYRLRGEHKPSPFFDADGRPVKAPRTLSET